MFLLVTFSIAILYLFQELYWKRRNLPPGPCPWPIVGNIPTIDANAPGYEAYRKWANEYGPVYTFWMGNVPMIAVTDYQTIKETIIKDGEKYTGRFILPEPVSWSHVEKSTRCPPIFHVEKGGEYGVVDIGGERWREQRRFVLHTLRDFGMGKNVMEERVQIEVDALLERLETQKTVAPQKQFDLAVGSIINNLMFGYRFDENNISEFYSLKDTLTHLMADFTDGAGVIVLVYPVLRFLPYFKKIWGNFWGYRETLFNFFGKQIAERRRNLDVESEVTLDFVESFLKTQHQKRNEEDNGGYTDLQLKNLLFDLWVAGMETTANTLTWAVVYLLNYPEVQEKIHKELDDVIKSERKITLDDRNGLPYMGASLCEVQRQANLFALNLFRKTTEDTMIGGFTVSKGTFVVPQISCVKYDEKVFTEPYAFRPERFFSKHRNLLKIDEFIPFSVGKRACLGEGLAKLELFLFAANMMQKFKISSSTKPSMEKVAGITMAALPFTCEFVDRRE